MIYFISIFPFVQSIYSALLFEFFFVYMYLLFICLVGAVLQCGHICVHLTKSGLFFNWKYFTSSLQKKLEKMSQRSKIMMIKSFKLNLVADL